MVLEPQIGLTATMQTVAKAHRIMEAIRFVDTKIRNAKIPSPIMAVAELTDMIRQLDKLFEAMGRPANLDEAVLKALELFQKMGALTLNNTNGGWFLTPNYDRLGELSGLDAYYRLLVAHGKPRNFNDHQVSKLFRELAPSEKFTMLQGLGVVGDLVPNTFDAPIMYGRLIELITIPSEAENSG